MPNKIWSAAAFGGVLSLASLNNANALPLAPIPQVTGTSDITVVADCGPGFLFENGRCRPDGRPAAVVFPPPVARPVDVALPVRCGPGFRLDPRFNRCVIL
jgi:hypothetical protein